MSRGLGDVYTRPVLGLELRWVFRQWADFARTLADDECDGIWCGSAITLERERRFLYTRPYAIFDEAVVVRAGDAIGAAKDLDGRRVGAIAGSTNMALAETFAGAECVAFDGVSDDVFGDMLRALRDGSIDAVVDDDVAFIGIERAHPGLRVAFTVTTRNPWGCALRLGDSELKELLDRGIAEADLAAAWRCWLPSLPYPL
jgi:polar amino acid transport system substrate-binding protein